MKHLHLLYWSLTCSILLSLPDRITGAGNLPAVINIEIPFNSTFTIQLKLVKAKKTRITVIEEGPETKVTQEEETTTAYNDWNYRALFTVSVEKGRNIYFGTFFLEGEPYIIGQVEQGGSGYPDLSEREWKVMVDGYAYMISKYKTQLLNRQDDEIKSPPPTKEKEKKKRVYVSTGKQDLTIEVLLMMDQSAYKNWLKLYKSHDKTIQHMKFYYAHIMNGVDDVFRRIQHPEFSLRCVTSAMYIAENEEQSEFTKMRNESIDPLRTLEGMVDWLSKVKKSKTFQWPEFDVAVMIDYLPSGNNLGMAYCSTMCQSTSVALAQSRESFVIINTIIHEIGHVLGSSHDSVGNDCPKDDMFIMTPISFYRTHLYHNEDKFSKCSLDQIAAGILKLNKNDNNCLLNKPTTSNPPLKNKLGQFFSLDQQCRFFIGEDSKLCADKRIGDELCKHIVCEDPSSHECVYRGNRRAMDGTSCGNKEWCIKGACVAEERSNEVKDCAYGNKYPEECKQGLCDNKAYAAMCCDTCSKVTKDGCQLYEPSWCQKLNPSRCNEEFMQKYCCQTCLRFKNRGTGP